MRLSPPLIMGLVGAGMAMLGLVVMLVGFVWSFIQQ